MVLSRSTSPGWCRRAAAVAAGALVLSLLAVVPPAAAAVPAPGVDEAATQTGPAGDVVLAWTHVEGATGYRVMMSTSPAFDTLLYSATTPSLRATPNVALPAGTVYWRVVALEGTATSAPVDASFERATILGPEILGPGAGDVVEVLHYPNDPPVLSWRPLPGVRTYTVELSTDDTFPAGGTQVFATSATSYAVGGLLTRGTTWRWRVKGATDTGVTTQYSALGQFRIDWPGSQPVLQGDAAGALDAAPPYITDIDLQWTVVPGAARYKVEVSTDPTFASAVPGTPVTVLTNRFTPARSFDNGSYYWKVTAVDPAGNEGPPSATSQFIRSWNAGSEPTMTAPAVMAAPKVLSATGGATVSQSDFELAWSAVPRASVYEVWLTSETSNFFTDSGKILRCYTPHTTATAFDVYQGLVSASYAPFTHTKGCVNNLGRTTGWPVEGTFRWRVRALDLAGNDTATHALTTENVDGLSRFIRSAWSDRDAPADPAQFTLAAPRAVAPGLTPALTAPGHCADPLSGTCTVHPDAPTLVWDPVEDAVAGYWVELALDAEFTNKVGEFHTLSSRLRLNGGLLDNSASQAYHWRVMGCASFVSFTNKSCLQSGSANARSFLKRGKAPQGLSVSSAGDHVTFRWDEHLLTAPDGGGTRGYEVEVSTDELYTSTNRVLSAKVDQPFLTTSLDLLQDGAYFWRVRPLDGAASPLPWAGAGPFTKSAAKPLPVRAVSGPSAPVLRWPSVPGTSSYDIQVFRGPDLSGTPVLTQTALRGTAAVPAALAPGQYSWRVRRSDVASNVLAWSGVAGDGSHTFSISSDPVALAAPGADATVALKDRVLSWVPVPGAVRYRVQLSTSQAFSTTVESVDTVQTRHAPTSSLVSGTAYYWRVLPLHASAASLTGTAEARPIWFWNVPTVPTSVKAVVNGTTIDLTWGLPTNSGGTPVTAYVVRYRPEGTDAWTMLRTSTRSAALEQLDPGTKYQIQVAATNDVGTGPYSAVVVATTAGLPGAPTLTGATKGDRSATVTWTAPTSNGGASITSYTVTSEPGGKTATVAGTLRTATVTGLTNGTPYTFTVTASNSVGTSLPSNASDPVTPAAGSVYVPVEPVRVLSGQAVGAGGTYTLTLSNVPVGASAVTFNLAAAGVTGNTYVTACPGGTTVTTCKQKASLNTDRRDRSNLVTVKLGGLPTSTSRTVLLYNNVGSVLLYADLQGYHVDQAVTGSDKSTGSMYAPAEPTRVLAAQEVGPGGTHELVLTNVPVGATAVTFNLAAAGVTANTYVTACPGGTPVDTCNQKASLNAVPSSDTANLVTVKLGGDPTSTSRTVLLYNNLGSVLLFADLQGYFVPTGGSTFVPRDPTRVLSAQSLGQGGVHTLTLSDVPVGATAVAFNLAAAGVTGNTYISACPGGTPTTSCNQKANLLTSTGNDAAVFVVVKLGGDPTSTTRTVLLYNNVGSTQLYADLQGFYA